MSVLRIFLIPALLALTGCGFQPLYGNQDQQANGLSVPVAQSLDEIQIGLIPDRTGQILHQALEDDLQRDGAPTVELYHLTINNYGIGSQVIGIQTDSSATRLRYIANANWTLSPISDPRRILTKGNAQANDAINILDQQYFALSLQDTQVKTTIAREIAEQITAGLAIYFRKHPQAQ
ncbi:MAG TPA: LPS assembly lipoprotein LptE [Acetobacteraceae bacterium]|nr:LPS assembly lipoprotein LptE [Acetobacteraceae bacterium]